MYNFLKCYHKYCLDELAGVVAIIICAIGYILQFLKMEKSLDVSSFSIIALYLFAFGELFFLIQGIYKKSITIVITRCITFCGLIGFIIIWYIGEKKIKDKNKK